MHTCTYQTKPNTYKSCIWPTCLHREQHGKRSIIGMVPDNGHPEMEIGRGNLANILLNLEQDTYARYQPVKADEICKVSLCLIKTHTTVALSVIRYLHVPSAASRRLDQECVCRERGEGGVVWFSSRRRVLQKKRRHTQSPTARPQVLSPPSPPPPPPPYAA